MASKRAVIALSRALRPAHTAQSVRVSNPLRRPTLCPPRPVSNPRIPHNSYTTSTRLFKEEPAQPDEIKPSILYNFKDLEEFTASPSQNRIIIDVREPAELLETGTIPGSKNIPVSSSPDAFFLSPEEFEDKFGFERPGKEDEVVFFCKAGVRSRAAARLAQQAGFGGQTGEYPGSWLDWVSSGGKVQRN